MKTNKIKEIEKEINNLKDWIQVWIINKEQGDSWKRLMEKELYENDK